MDGNLEFVEIARPFAEAIVPLAAVLGGLPTTRSKQRTALQEAVAQIVRKCHDAVLPAIRPAGVSATARATAAEVGVDLSTLVFGREPRTADEKKEKLVYLEHVTPLSMLRDMFIKEPSAHAVLQVLDTHLHAIWITEDERGRLDRKHRSNRPDPRAAFNAADIVVDQWPS